MATYEVTTEKGTYQVETGEESQQQPQTTKEIPQLQAASSIKTTKVPRPTGNIIIDLLANLPKASPGDLNAQAQNAAAISKVTGMPINEVIRSGSMHNANVTGMLSDPNSAQLGMAAAAPYMFGATLAGLVAAPLPTVAAIGVGKLVENVPIANRITPLDASESTKALASLVDLSVKSAAVGTAFKVSDNVVNAVAPRMAETSAKLAGRIVDSLIKAPVREYSVGRNPGEGVAKEGITALSLPALKEKISARLDDLTNNISLIRSSPNNANKTINVKDVLNPLREVYGKLKNYGEQTHAAEITRIDKIFSDINSNGKNMEALSVTDAYNLKNAVDSFIDWSSPRKEVNGALRQVYHKIDSKIDIVVPELKSLNERTANLITAKKAVSHRIDVIRNTEPGPTALKLLELPFVAFKTTPGKTLMANLLAKSKIYPKLK
jgi:hypothetical protein